MDVFLQRIIERCHDQVFRKMSAEKRARNLCMVKALARASLKIKNKENADPLNNNMTHLYSLKHSTPLKNQQVTDLDIVEPESQMEYESPASEKHVISESQTVNLKNSTEPKLVIAKIYELTPDTDGKRLQNKNEDDSYKNCSNCNNDDFDSIVVNNLEMEVGDEAWKSLEVLDSEAESEFFRSLEESKLTLSKINLLEEIEADLPSRYSLARPLNHTFHSLTSYRTITRLARVDANVTCLDTSENNSRDDVRDSSKRLAYLEMEAFLQKAKAKQAEKALILSKTKKPVEVENLEIEKTVFLANLRFNAVVSEIEKLKLLGDSEDQEDFGQITISEITFSVDESATNKKETHLCTVTERENVQYFPLLSTTNNGKLCFKKPLKFQNLTKDFVIYVELFRHRVKEAKTPMKRALMKRLKELTSANFQKSLTLPSSHQNFVCLAWAELRLEDLKNRQNDACQLQFVEPPCFPITNSVTLHVKTDINIKCQQSGFLNIFQRTWHRRWFHKNGYFLNSWLYPEDRESEGPAIDSIYLANCSEPVKRADMEVCIRPYSFVLTQGADSSEKILFSADSQREMKKWMDCLNLTIEHLRLWKPDV